LLTTELFKRQSEDPNLARPEGLRQSMLSLMDKGSPGGFSYAHPVFWAPFSLVGDGGR
jgi:CHAT domain-containing protein